MLSPRLAALDADAFLNQRTEMTVDLAAHRAIGSPPRDRPPGRLGAWRWTGLSTTPVIPYQPSAGITLTGCRPGSST
jgi:hypothetical protein